MTKGRDEYAKALKGKASIDTALHPEARVAVKFDSASDATLAALAKHKNNRLRAAGELGISRMGLYKKLHKYGLAQRRQVEPQKEIA